MANPLVGVGASAIRVESTTPPFHDKCLRGNHVRLYDVAPDDQRFILVRPANDKSSTA